ncbi:MAG: electron transfer flavoprotein subunit alpha/FixB family protein [Mesorhizobium sp.]
MKILVYVETAGAEIAGVTHELIALARELAGGSGEVEALVAAQEPAAYADALRGVDTVITIAHPALASYTQTSQSACIRKAVAERKPEVILFGYTSCGVDLAPFLAIQADMPLASYCTQLSANGGTLTAECQIYGGKFTARTSLACPAVVAVTPGSYREGDFAAKAAKVVALDPPAELGDTALTFHSATPLDPNALDITQIDKLVSVGRGIGDQDNIKEAEELAGLIGGALVGSRPIVDLGWLPKERQVGKSGRKVKPKLYLALGISGAPEHLEGMSASDLIIAVNSDAKAPIFQIAHYGATVDCLEVLESLKKAVGARA